MKTLTSLVLIIFIILGKGYAQVIIENLIPYGKYDVGFKTKIIEKLDEEYKYHDMQIKKPFFIAMWYPIKKKKNINNNILTYKNAWKIEGTKEQNSVIDSIKKNYKNSLKSSIQDSKKYQKNEMVSQEIDQMMGLFEEIRLISKVDKNEIKYEFPAVLYHHGSQGTLFENIHMCEWLASNGYIVYSTNFTWPSDAVDKLIPSTKYKEKYIAVNQENLPKIENEMKNDELENLDFIIKQIYLDYRDKPLKLIALGHSYGAQRLIFNDTKEKKIFSKIISLDNAWDGMSDEDLTSVFPLEFNLISNSKIMTTPKFIITNESYLKRGSFTSKIYHTSLFGLIIPIEHRSFTSENICLYQFNDKFHLKEADDVKKELNGYAHVCNLILNILNDKPIKSNKDYIIKQ